MNWDQIEGKWNEIKGDVRQKWAKMTDSDFDKIGGKKDELSGWLQKNYGYTKEQVDKEISDFKSDAGHTDTRPTPDRTM